MVSYFHKLFCLFFLQMLCFSLSQGGQYTAEEIAEIKQNTDIFIEKILKCRDVVGMNVAVVKNDQTLFTEGYGYTDLATHNKVTNETLFGIASLTKAMAAFSLGKTLHENGYFWDTPIKDIVDDFETDDSYRTWHATSRDLAAHKMGLPSHNNLRFGTPTRKELFKKLRYLRFTKEFRTSFMYNNLMYGLMSYLTERIDGSSWEDVLRKKIFKPLGMNSTSFTHEIDFAGKEIALPYRHDNEIWREVNLTFHSFWGQLGGSGSVISTANDMAKWIKLHINAGNNEKGESVISEEYLRELHLPSNTMPYDKRHGHRKPEIPVTLDLKTYGMGWRIGTYRGYTLSTHTGTSFGYGGLITILHEPKIAIYTGITGTDPNYTGRYLIHFHLINQLLGEAPSWPDISLACTYRVSNSSSSSSIKSNTVELPLTDLTRFVGTFGNFAYGNVTFYMEDNTLNMRYGKQYIWKLFAISNNTFYGKGMGLNWIKSVKKIEFEDSQEVNKVTISLESRDPPKFIRGLDMRKSLMSSYFQVHSYSLASHDSFMLISMFPIFICMSLK